MTSPVLVHLPAAAGTAMFFADRIDGVVTAPNGSGCYVHAGGTQVYCRLSVGQVHAAILAAYGDQSAEMLTKTIHETNLSVRSTNCLLNADINTVADLVALSVDDLSNIRGFGETSIAEVFNFLANNGLSLRAVPRPGLSRRRMTANDPASVNQDDGPNAEGVSDRGTMTAETLN